MNRLTLLPRIYSVRSFSSLANCFRLMIWLGCSSSFAQGTPQMGLERTQLIAGMHRLDVQLAQTQEQRQIGLMWRKDMPQHEGMCLFLTKPAPNAFGCATR